MSEIKHTPGPWHRDASSGMNCDVRAANGRKIAVTYGLQQARTKEGHDQMRAVADANAHLIAAAPELLAALMAICNAEDEAADVAAMKLAIAAIAKATGQP